MILTLKQVRCCDVEQINYWQTNAAHGNTNEEIEHLREINTIYTTEHLSTAKNEELLGISKVAHSLLLAIFYSMSK